MTIAHPIRRAAAWATRPRTLLTLAVVLLLAAGVIAFAPTQDSYGVDCGSLARASHDTAPPSRYHPGDLISVVSTQPRKAITTCDQARRSRRTPTLLFAGVAAVVAVAAGIRKAQLASLSKHPPRP